MNGSIPQSQLSNDAAFRLICLPYAGGGAAGYFRWRAAMPAGLDLLPLSLPGHDGRLHEPPVTNLCELARSLADELIKRAIDRPFALLGHSMGAWLAFELTRELRRRHARMPSLLVVSASRAPHSPVAKPFLHRLPDDELLTAIDKRFDGIPAPVRAEQELLRILLPALRADLQMIETYDYVEEQPLEVDILALGGTEDPAVSVGQLLEWRRHTTRDCSVRLLSGGHFFLFQGDNELKRADNPSQSREPTPALRMILARLQPYLAAAQAKPERERP